MFIVRWLDRIGNPMWEKAPTRTAAENMAARRSGSWQYVTLGRI